MLVSVDMLADLHQAQGFAARDLMIKQIAVQLRLLCQRYAEPAISRLSAREFALLVPVSNPEHLLLLGKEINQRIRAAVLEHASDLTAHSVEHSVEQSTEHSTEQSLSLVGIAVLTEQDNASALLTRADHALSQARIEGGASVIIANGG